MKLTHYKTMILAGVGGALLVLLLLSQLLTRLVDVDAALAPLKQRVESLVGQPLIIEEVSVGILSGPHIEINGVAIRNVTEAREPYLLYADTLTIALGWGDLFADEPQARSMTVQGLRIYLEKGRDGGKNWYFLSKSKQQVSAVSQLELNLQNASLRYVDLASGEDTQISAIHGTLGVGALGVQAQLSAQVMDQAVALKGDCTVAHFSHLASYDALCNAEVASSGLTAQANYRLLMSNAGLQMRGNLSANMQDARLWGDAISSQQGRRLQQYLAQAVPLKFVAETFYAPSRLIVNLSEFALGESVGKGSLSRQTQAGGQTTLNVQAAFEKVDFDAMKALIANAAGTDADLFARTRLAGDRTNGSLQLSAKKVIYNGVDLTNLRISGQLEKGQVSITEAYGSLPQEGRFNSVGRLIAADDGLQYEGNVEASGRAFWTLAPLVDAKAGLAAKQLLTQYRTRFNCSLSPRSSVVSQLRLQVGKASKTSQPMRIAGAMTLKKAVDNMSELTGSIGIKNADMRPFWHEWLNEQSLLKPPPQTPSGVLQGPLAFEWLNRGGAKVNLLLQVGSAQVPNDWKADGHLRLQIDKNQLALNEIDAKLGKMRLSGSASINTAGERPKLNAKLAFSQMQLGNWLREDIWLAQGESKDGAAPSVWSKAPLNVNPLKYYDASLDVTIAQLKHDALEANNVHVLAQLENQLLTIRPWTMQWWGGAFSATAKLDVSSVPNLHLQYRHDNASLQPLMQRVFAQEALSGRISLAHTIKTSGVNFHEWMKSISGGLRFDVKGLTARNFNLARMMQLVSSARSVSDVPNIVRQTQAGGSTRLQRMQGTTYYEDGKLKTTAIDFAANGVSGQVVALLNVMQWTMNTAIQIDFAALAKGSVKPQLGVRYSGAFDGAKRTLNLKAIEAFLAQKQR